MRSLWAGVSFAKTLCVSAACASSASFMRSTSAPSSTPFGSRPTSRQILAVTSSLSPVSTLTATPCAASALSAGAARLLRRIEERDVADQGQVDLVGHAVVRLGRRQLLDGHRDHAQPFLVERSRDLARCARAAPSRQRLVDLAVAHAAAHLQASPRPRPCRSAGGVRRARPPPPTCAGAGSRTGSRRPCGRRSPPRVPCAPRRAPAPPRRAGSSGRSGSSC